MRGRSTKTKALVDRVIEILEEIKPTTVRGVAYRLFSEGLIPNMSKRHTGRLSRILTHAREDGAIPWHWLVDPSRPKHEPPTYRSPFAFGRSVSQWWIQDPWEYQDSRVEIWSEKNTVNGILGPVLHHYKVAYWPIVGWNSASNVYTAAREIAASRHLIVLYIGDWDPSGLYMSEVDLPRRLRRYGARKVDLRRIALAEGDLPALGGMSFPATAKRRDSRYRWFVERHGHQCYEPDAMDPNALRDRVAAAIREHIDPVAWDRVAVVDEAVQESLDHYMREWTRAASTRALVQRYRGDESLTEQPLNTDAGRVNGRRPPDATKGC